MSGRRRATSGKRRARGALAAAALVCGCGGPLANRPAPPRPATLRLDPLVDLVAAAGLVWLADVRLRELLADPVLGPVATAIAPADRLDAFARRHGGVDLRLADEVTVASFGRSVLALALVGFEPGRVEAAFGARELHVDGRASDRGVTRAWGTVGPDRSDEPPAREQIALFGHNAVGFERGALGPLQAATFFAEGRLKRALPALETDPLAAVAERLGPLPLRAFAPGPFIGGPWATGLGGLLGAATAVGAGAGTGGSGLPGLRVRVVLSGAWGADAPGAAKRLEACYAILSEDPMGRLLGMNRPLQEPSVRAEADTLQLDVVLDPAAVARGTRAMTDASAAEIMAF